jgi:GxxExxY protein
MEKKKIEYYASQIADASHSIDILVENEVIIEIKAVEILLPVHTAQLISYLKLADKQVGFLINFNVPVFKEGIHRYVNNF